MGYSKPDAGWVSLAYEGGALLGVPGLAILSDALLGGRKMLGVQVNRCPQQAHKLSVGVVGVLV